MGEGSGAVEVTASSMVMEIKAVTEALKYLQLKNYTRAVIITDSMSTLQKVRKEYLYADWVPLISASSLENVTWIFSPGHAGVRGNERADSLAGDAAIDNNPRYNEDGGVGDAVISDENVYYQLGESADDNQGDNKNVVVNENVYHQL